MSADRAVPLETPLEVKQSGAAVLRGGAEDRRPTMPEPPPVRLVSVGDIRLPMTAGREHLLDRFYLDLLRFERAEPAPGDHGPVYRAENHELRFHVVETPPQREECRPIGIAVPHFVEVAESLEAEEIEHEFVRGLIAGTDGVLLQDPAGNWIALAPLREVR